MDATGMAYLSKIMYEDRLRQADRARRIWHSERFRRLPKLVQLLVLALS
jgi:hypothetical protein